MVFHEKSPFCQKPPPRIGDELIEMFRAKPQQQKNKIYGDFNHLPVIIFIYRGFQSDGIRNALDG